MTFSVIVKAGLLMSVAACGNVNFEPLPDRPDAQPMTSECGSDRRPGFARLRLECPDPAGYRRVPDDLY
jgi:hypothetical protein